jgi:hypothetical protein
MKHAWNPRITRSSRDSKLTARPRTIALVTVSAILAVSVVASCTSAPLTSSPAAEGTQVPSPSQTMVAIADPLDGRTWRNTFTCDDMAKALDRAGLHEYERQVLPQFGRCDSVKHTTFAFANGQLAITTDDGTTHPQAHYYVVDDHTYVSGFLRNTYRVQGDRLVIVDTQIIRHLYPYNPKIIPRETAFNVAWLESAPFVAVH